jgi:hypothetical protein
VFIDDAGNQEAVSFESFRDFVVPGTIKDEWWSLATNFHNVQTNDVVWIYMGDQNLGVIGRATVETVELDADEWWVQLRIDRRSSSALCEHPFGADRVRAYVPYPRSAVVGLAPHPGLVRALERWMGDEPAASTLALKKLGLKPRRTTQRRAQRGTTVDLAHDSILEPIDTLLRGRRFRVGIPGTGRQRADLVGTRGDLTVIVEAKTIGGARGREAARHAFGQLHDYAWMLERQGADPARTLLWVAFDAKPDGDVIQFLEHYRVVVSWSARGSLTWSRSSKANLAAWM